MKKTKRGIPCILYLYIHKRIYERFQNSKPKVSEIQSFMFEWKIPKRLRYLILKELELLGLIKLNGRRRTNIKEPIFDEEDLNEYYEELDVY